MPRPLIGLDDALAPTPRLAEKWTLSEDGLTWTFLLRQGVRFVDGTAFDADVAIRNIRRFMHISPRTSPYTAMNAPVAFGPVTDLCKQDTLTFQIVHSSPYPLVEATMSNFFSAMFSPASFAANGDFNGIPATTGPWRLTDWQRGQSLVLERNDGYWGRGPALQKVLVRVIPDINTRVSALIAGEVDAIVELGALLPAQAKQLQTQPELVVGADPRSITQYLPGGSPYTSDSRNWPRRTCRRWRCTTSAPRTHTNGAWWACANVPTSSPHLTRRAGARTDPPGRASPTGTFA